MALSTVCRAASASAWLSNWVPVRLAPAPAPDNTPPVPVVPLTVAVMVVPIAELLADVPTLASDRFPTVTL